MDQKEFNNELKKNHGLNKYFEIDYQDYVVVLKLKQSIKIKSISLVDWGEYKKRENEITLHMELFQTNIFKSIGIKFNLTPEQFVKQVDLILKDIVEKAGDKIYEYGK